MIVSSTLYQQIKYVVKNKLMAIYVDEGKAKKEMPYIKIDSSFKLETFQTVEISHISFTNVKVFRGTPHEVNQVEMEMLWNVFK